MKRTLFLIALSCACLTSAQADTVSIDFGSSNTQTVGSVNLTEKDFKPNTTATEAISLSLGSSMQGTVQLEIVPTTGWLNNIYPTVKGSASSSSLAGSVPSFTGSDYKSSELDGLYVCGGRDLATGTKYSVPDLVITFANLAAGTYSMEILSGWNGQNPMHAGLSFTLGGKDIITTSTSWASKEANNVLPSSWTEKTTQPGGTLTTELVAGSYADTDAGKNRGVVANASDIIVKEGATLTLTISGDKTNDWDSNCINNIKLTSNNTSIPEPATATLSLLGFATLILRRKRK